MKFLTILGFVGSTYASAAVLHMVGQPALVGRSSMGLQARQDTYALNDQANNCSSYYGPDWTTCASDNYCYNPSIQICCQGGWHCDKGNYCIDGNRCCPEGDTLEECGATESFYTIPRAAATPEPSTGPASTTDASPTPTATEKTMPPADGGTNSSKTWIAGPVIGGCVGLLLLVGGAYLFRRKRAKRASLEDAGGLYEKPQLHSDHIPRNPPEEAEDPVVYEMQGSIPEPVEMAVNEVPARELPQQTTTVI